jgi:cobalt-zinc-cadmium resistance protein CzcA
MKKVIISNFCLLLTIAIFASNIKAQNRLSLDQALEKAYQNNLQLQANELEYKSAQVKQKSIVALPKTNVNALLGQMNTIRFDENISISQDIPNQAYIRAQREAAGQEAGLVKQQMAINKQELGYNLRQSWYQWIYLRELKGVLVREDSLLQSFAQAAAAKFKAGESRLLEKTSAESRRQQLLQSIVQVDMLLQVELMKMQQYMGLTTAFEPENNPLNPLRFELSDSAALAKHPMLQLIRQEIALSEANRKVAETEKLPDFSAGYFIQSLAGPQEINSVMRDFSRLPQFQGVSIGINLPIFGSKAYKAKQEVFEIQKSAQTKQSENIQWQLQQQLVQALSQYNFWQQHLNYYKNTALTNAESIIQNATKAYRSGEIEYIEYLQALQTGLEIRKGYLDSINNLNQTVLRMEYLVGK